MTRINVIFIAAACLLAGWIFSGGGETAEAQTGTQAEVQEVICQFEIPQDIRIDGAPVLLDQCTGNTWRFDSGWDYSESSYARPYSWQFVKRQGQ